jgi:L-lactate dehydrogenase complex protein LldG
MSTRDRILDRVKQSLKRESPEPHWLHEPVSEGPEFNIPPNEPAAMLEAFTKELTSLFGEVHAMSSVGEARTWIEKEAFPSILAPDCARLKPVLDGLSNVQWIGRDNVGRVGWEDFACGVTPTIGLAAESGTVAVAADVSGRAMSVLPPTHVVIATMDQLLPDFASAVKSVRTRYGGNLPSTISFITGPSRTADIEKILVLGAHGPKRLVVIVLPAGSLPAVD